jgi:hypothetical protein
VFVSRANQAAAVERISRSNFSLRFSRRNRLSSSHSAVVRPPSPWPVLRAAWATQFLIDCAVGSTPAPTPPANNQHSPTQRSVAEIQAYRVALSLAIADSLNANVPMSTKPGQLHT